MGVPRPIGIPSHYRSGVPAYAKLSEIVSSINSHFISSSLCVYYYIFDIRHLCFNFDMRPVEYVNRPFSHCFCACVYRSCGLLFLNNRRDVTQMGQMDFESLILSM